ncbi:alpha/beta fold hydrolase [Pseudonocardia sp. GCM10023141]|uniref:alpha/beta fold hydrolase n=1 Tax=Pseudonocardia sp. GCM10023141 TaxID=3252653 RepID=UPI003612870C
MTTPTTTSRLLPLTVPGDVTSVVHRWRQVAATLGDRPAVSSAGVRYSFARADAVTDVVAARLLATVPDDGTPVLTLLDHSAEGVLALWSVMKAGRILVALDRHLPVDRLRRIVELSGSTCVVTDAEHAGLAAALGATTVLRFEELAADVDGPGAVADRARVATVAVAGLDDPLCIVFTSGSTGVPKGVVVTHGHALNDAHHGAENLRIGVADRVVQVLPLSFAGGFMLMLKALLHGAGIWAYDPRDRGVRGLEPLLAQERLTVLGCTPHLLRALVAALPSGHVLDTVRLVTTCGEAVYGRDYEALRPHLRRGASYVNWSGSSEVGNISFHEIGWGAPEQDGPIPAGRIASNKEVRILADDGAPVAAGETGELVVVSDYMSAGYWRNPTAEATKFGRDADGRRLCRPGDMARVQDGVLSFAGRTDAAVKIRGYLTDPSEVEAAIVDSDAVAEAAVIAVVRPPAASYLVAYVAADKRFRAEEPAMIRRRLRQRLPEYMVPSVIVAMAELPRNERGRVDRQALPPAAPPTLSEPPTTQWEIVLSDLWGEVLGLDSVGLDDDFMELGGDSLTAQEMRRLVAERLGIALTSADLVEAPTLRRFTRRVTLGSASLPSHPDIVSLRTGGAGTPAFCFAGGGSLALTFVPIARHLGDRPVYGFQAHGLEQRARPDRTVEAAAHRALQLIRVIQPHGPYILVGHSFGGLVALETARWLEQAGETVRHLTLLDTYHPTSSAGAVLAPLPPIPDDIPAAAGAPSLWRRSLGTVGTAVHRRVQAVLPDGLPELDQLGERVRARLAGIIAFPGQHQFDAFFDNSGLVARRYALRPLTTPVLLILGDDNPDGAHAWTPLLTGPHKIVEIAAEHSSLMREPHASDIGALITAELGDDRR